MKASNLKHFQQDFGDYIRKQAHESCDTIPKRVGELYQTLIFRAVAGFVNQCFPVCRKIIDESVWHRLLLSFIKQGDMSSPYFSEINKQFVDYLDEDIITAFDLHPCVAELAHYEWIELYVDNLPNIPPKLFLEEDNRQIFINSTLQVLKYSWEVHQIGSEYLPTKPQDTFVLVYRSLDEGYQTAFMQINIVSFIVLTFIQETDKVYPSLTDLIVDIVNYFGLKADLMDQTEELFRTLFDAQVMIEVKR